jgi:hypothetical protein
MPLLALSITLAGYAQAVMTIKGMRNPTSTGSRFLANLLQY